MIDFVDQHRQRHGLNTSLSAIGLPRSSYYRHQRTLAARQADNDPVAPADGPLVAAIRKIIAEHPGYGWRRLQSELAHVHGLEVNHKRLKRVLASYELGLRRNIAKRRRRGPSELLALHQGELDLVTGRQFGPVQVLSMDFTEFAIANGAQKVWLMAMVDIHSRLVTGWAVDTRRCTEMALRAWQMTQQTLSFVSVRGTTSTA